MTDQSANEQNLLIPGSRRNARVEESRPRGQALKWEALKATKGCFGCQNGIGLGFSTTSNYRVTPSNAPVPSEVMGLRTLVSSTRPVKRHCYPQPLGYPSSEVDLNLGQRWPKQPLAKRRGLKGCKPTEATGLRAHTCKVACREVAPRYRTPCKFSTRVWILCLNKNQP